VHCSGSVRYLFSLNIRSVNPSWLLPGIVRAVANSPTSARKSHRAFSLSRITSDEHDAEQGVRGGHRTASLCMKECVL
jgi:hypothetical protein